MLHAIIMAGGAGTRFWPASRVDRPKQLLALSGEQTMMQSTVSRLNNLCPAENIRVITNRRLVEPIAEQLPELPAQSIVGEPCKRDTAPCIGLAAEMVLAQDPEGVMVVMPADHVITPVDQFQSAIRSAEQLVAANPEQIVTFGIKPNYPATVFGYIERGQPIQDPNATCFQVARFREKPDADTAKQFLDSGNFYWNAGIFVWRAATIRQALETHAPGVSAHLKQIAASFGTAEYEQVLEREFTAIDGISIDFAVMEKHDNVAVIEAPFEWNDVGNWTALESLVGQDSHGNTLLGNQLAIDCENTIVRNDGPDSDGHLIATVGLRDMVVIRTQDATLIIEKSREAEVKKIVKELESRNWQQYL